MRIRAVFLVIIVLALAGCAGWASKQPLIPPGERDPVGLSGTYHSGSGSLRITPAAEGLYLVQDADPDAAGEDAARQPSEVAFDLLRSRKAPADSPDAELARDYLVQARWEDDLGEVSYLYTIVTVAGAKDADPGTVATFDMLCAKSTLAFAVREEEGFCIFDDYLKLRAAAFDALAWRDDARMELSETRYRPAEPLAP